MTWNAAMAWVASLTYRGIGGWRFALNPDGSGPCTGNHCDQSEFGHLVFGPWTTDPNTVNYLNADPYATYWTSTEASQSEAFAFEFPNVRQGGLLKDPFDIPDGTVFVPLPGPGWPGPFMTAMSPPWFGNGGSNGSSACARARSFSSFQTGPL